jgi:hypothetical protein
MALTLPIGAPRAKNPALTVPLSSTSRVFKRSLYSRPKPSLPGANSQINPTKVRKFILSGRARPLKLVRLDEVGLELRRWLRVFPLY